HLLDLVLELEVFEDALHVAREALNVADDMPVDVVWVALKFLEVERRVVVKTLARNLVELCVERVAREFAALGALVLGHDLCLSRRKHAVEAPQYSHGQHNAFILWRAVRPAEQICNLPDEVREVSVVKHAASSRHVPWVLG